MKIAKVRLTASGIRYNTHTVPTTRNDYKFRKYTGSQVAWTAVDNVEDAAYFDEHQSFAVEWTPVGLLTRAYDSAASSVHEALSKLGYREKQQLAKERGIKANQSEEKLEAELAEAADELARQLEHQR